MTHPTTTERPTVVRTTVDSAGVSSESADLIVIRSEGLTVEFVAGRMGADEYYEKLEQLAEQSVDEEIDERRRRGDAASVDVR
jgi:hypothetical protein